MLAAEHIEKSFFALGVENRVLKDISITIERGQFVCVVGRSGSGKSTFLNVLSTLLKPDRGRVKYAGEDVSTLPEHSLNRLRQKDFSLIFQQYHLLSYLNALENVLLPFMNTVKPITRTQLQKARDCLERVGIGDKERRLPSQLSGGEQQRVSIARALVKSPSVLFADEPTGNLDRKTGDNIIELMKSLNDDGLTILMVTHETSYTAHATMVIEMDDGRIHMSPSTAN
jgi:ABC-type lipoprotein export system ATPase subunit